MTEVVGPQMILTLGLPTGVDGIKIAQWSMIAGRTFTELVGDLALAIGAFNQDMINDWGWLMSLTEEQAMEYPDGSGVTALKEITDADKVDSVHGTTIGHMIDLKAYGGGIGGSKRWMRDAREAQFLSMLRTILRQAQWRFELKLLNRLFTNTENSIGATGYDVPVVRGSGGNVDFVPPAYGGEIFESSHDHFLGVDSDSLGYGDMLNALAETIQEHGHDAPFDAIVSRADISSYYALEDFIEIVDPIVSTIDRASVTSGNRFFTPGQREFGMIGYFQSEYGLVKLRSTGRVPTTNAAMAKSYGMNDARNSVAVRVHPDVGFGAYVVPETSGDDQYPIKQVNVEFEFGVSCGEDRTNGAAAVLVSGGAWSNPTLV